MEITRGRRITLALCGVAVAGWLLRPQLADALVVRGDGYLYVAQTESALREYERATVIDSGSEVAVDRFAFFAGTMHDRSLVERAIRITTSYLAKHPGDDTVRMDRAMAYRRLHRPAEALADLARVARDTPDPRAAALAGYCAIALGARDQAVEFWREALRERAQFPAALHGLRRLGLAR